MAVTLAALIPCLVFWRGALLRGVFFQADLVVYYLPAYTYATRVLRTGLIPLWAPEMESGQPFHAQWEPTLLYPVAAPFRFLLPPWWALNASLIFHYALAAVAMFAYARRISFSRCAALVSAAIYAVNGFMVTHLEHPNLVVGAAWLPLLLLGTEHGLNGRTLAGALSIGGGLAMMLLGGHPDLFLMGMLVLGLLVLLHPIRGILRVRRLQETLPPAMMLGGGALLGMGLGAVQVLPTLELVGLSWRSRAASVGYQDTWSLKPIQFLVQVLPDVFGRNGQDTYWGFAHYWEECSYVGALALALALAGLLSRHRLASFYGGLAVLSVWLAMGTNGLAFSALRQLPAFGTMRLPCRYMFLFDLSVAVLAGAGTHWLSHLRRPAETARARWLLGFAGGTFGVTALWLLRVWPGRGAFLPDVAGRLRERHRFHGADVPLLLHRYVAQLGVDAALLFGGLAVALVLLYLAARAVFPGRRREAGRDPATRAAIPPLALAGVVGTLFIFGTGYHTVVPARLIAEPPFTARAIRSSGPGGLFRVLTWDSIKLHADVAVHRGWWPTSEHGYRQYIAALPDNYNLVWGLAGVRQEEWSALPLRYTRQLTSAILAQGDRGGFRAVAPFLPWWNTGYVISQRPLSDPSLVLVTADRIHLYRTRDPGRRAWIVHQATTAPPDDRLLPRLLSDPAVLMNGVVLPPGDGVPGDFFSPRKREKSESAKSEVPRSGGAPKAGHRREAVVAGGPGGTAAQRWSWGDTEGHGGRRDQTREAAWIVRRTATRATVEAVAGSEGFLVLGETWAPGWHAWLDGRPAPVLRANLVHRAVKLPAGRHRVEFRYAPTSFRLGLFVSLAALAVLLAVGTARLGGRA